MDYQVYNFQNYSKQNPSPWVGTLRAAEKKHYHYVNIFGNIKIIIKIFDTFVNSEKNYFHFVIRCHSHKVIDEKLPN